MKKTKSVKEFTEKCPELTHEFNKVRGYKINTHANLLHFYILVMNPRMLELKSQFYQFYQKALLTITPKGEKKEQSRYAKSCKKSRKDEINQKRSK